MINEGAAIGWLPASFFGICFVVAQWQLVVRPSFLYINVEGFAVGSKRRFHTYKWSDVEVFYVHSIHGNEMVMFNMSPGFQRSSAMRSAAKSFTGFEGALPDTYSMTPKELAALLNDYRHQFMERSTTYNAAELEP
jgi:hypothetical protein